MALPDSFAEANLVLRPDPGEQAPIEPIPVMRANGWIVSRWRLDPQELAEILRTGVVWLAQADAGRPAPVMVTGCKAEALFAV